MHTIVKGTIIEGYHVASGPSRDYPYGTLEKQIPIFKQLGLDLEGFYPGTLNVSIEPLSFEMVMPAFTFRQVRWTDLHPPEDFSFSPCRIRVEQGPVPLQETDPSEVHWHKGCVYYPHPETKIRHFENASLIEVMCTFIPGIHYGDTVELEVNVEEIRIISEENDR
jgi:hypothetical protein